jgi:hypothetical protein
MADATFKPSSGDDLVLSNDDGSKKIEITDSGNIELTGDLTQNGNISMATNKKVKQKGAFLQSSTHQTLFLGA